MITKFYLYALVLGVLILGIGGWSALSIGNGIEPPKPAVSSVSQVPAEARSQDQNKLNTFPPPVYKPPKGIGAPGRRVGAGTRGQDSISLFALVPDHLGLTIDAQPTLYWYLSKPVPYPLILTVIHAHQTKPILETTVSTFPRAGIHSVPLKDFNIALEMDIEYQWSVSLAIDPNSHSKDIVAGGTIKRIMAGDDLRQKLRNAIPDHLTAIYSEEGLWYDALASISNLCEASPKGNHYCVGRKELLEQVDLTLDLMEIAKTEEDVTLPHGSLSTPSSAP